MRFEVCREGNIVANGIHNHKGFEGVVNNKQQSTMAELLRSCITFRGHFCEKISNHKGSKGVRDGK
jgi:hypothetical protein